jgi:hypothetical protein
MPFFRLVFNYSTRDNGWSEVYYREATNIEQASTFTTNLQEALMDPRAKSVSLKTCRVSETTNNRNTLIKTFTRKGGLDYTVDIASTAAILVLNAPTTGSRRHVWLRGLPDELVYTDENSGEQILDPILSQEITRYIRLISSNGFLIRSLAKLSTPPNSYYTVRTLSATANAGFIILEFAQPFFLPADGLIIVSQFNIKDWPGLKGQFRATYVDPTHVSIPYNWHTTGLFPVRTGRIRAANYLYGAISFASSGFLRFGSRDTGRGPIVGRGRRPGTRIRSA